MNSHELNKRNPTAYPATPDLASPLSPPPSAGTTPPAVLPFAPIRSAADYANASDASDDDDEPPTTRSPSSRTAHTSRPSAAGLLASGPSSADFAGAAARGAGAPSAGGRGHGEGEQAKARRIEEYDAPIRPLLDDKLTAVGKVRAFVRLNEGESAGWVHAIGGGRRGLL